MLGGPFHGPLLPHLPPRHDPLGVNGCSAGCERESEGFLDFILSLRTTGLFTHVLHVRGWGCFTVFRRLRVFTAAIKDGGQRAAVHRFEKSIPQKHSVSY